MEIDPREKGWALIAIYDKNPEEAAMCQRAKDDAKNAGKKRLVTEPKTGPQKGQLCLWVPEKDLIKGESSEHAGKRKFVPGTPRLNNHTRHKFI